jgi:NTE family protein
MTQSLKARRDTRINQSTRRPVVSTICRTAGKFQCTRASNFGVQAFVTFLALSFLCACSTPIINDPLKQSQLSNSPESISAGGYRWQSTAYGADRETLIILASSGGGKRSAAFSYGVLRGLRNFSFQLDGKQHRLLDDIDTYAAVSGGSFTAAYYGLYREKIFTDFERDFLKVNVDDYIWGTYLLPWHWQWLFSANFGTSDRMADAYNTLMFHGATFADLARNGKPIISINATDINYETVFSFTQDQFDLICSDLSTYPVSNAVAASNGLPIVFSPITLTNYANRCGGKEPSWIGHFGAANELSREHQLADLAHLYLDPEKTTYVHLLDGGIADNLAMRFTIEKALAYGDNAERIRELGLHHVRRILLISADGQATRDSASARRRNISGVGQIINAVSSSEIDIYNFETILLAKESVDRFVAMLKRIRCSQGSEVDGHHCDDVEGFFAHIALSEVQIPSVRERLLRIPTDLTIQPADVDQLVTAGEREVHSSKVLKDFRDSLSSKEIAPGHTPF